MTSKEEKMHLIVGLGNPGKTYQKNRHNVGFLLIERFAEKKGLKICKKKFKGLYEIYNHENKQTILLKPQTHMNNSGEIVKKYIDYFQIPIENVLIIYDDYYIEVGNFKLKEAGGPAGHNGLKSIENHLGTDQYKRLKIGISRDQEMLMSDYVLGNFNKEQQKKNR